MWFSKRRTIRHRTFGTLTRVREGRFWEARVAFSPAGGRRVSLAIAGADGPTDAQERLYIDLAEHYPRILPHALDALHGEYQRLRTAQPGAKFPQVEGPGEMARVARLDEIWLDCHHGHRFVLGFQSTRRKDQTFNVFFNHWELQGVSAESA